MLIRYQDSGEYVCTASNGIKGGDNRITQTGSGYVTVNGNTMFQVVKAYTIIYP